MPSAAVDALQRGRLVLLLLDRRNTSLVDDWSNRSHSEMQNPPLGHDFPQPDCSGRGCIGDAFEGGGEEGGVQTMCVRFPMQSPSSGFK